MSQPQLPKQLLVLIEVINKVPLSEAEKYGVNQAIIEIHEQMHELKTLKDIEKSRVESEQNQKKEVENAGSKQK